ncbi:MAG TPA: pyridoxal-phosphate dependent enzyme [Ignavibacteriaceae bacterium]|nr:pyridoxal-phosphate dependent enzyme [Ignavibacteriaceae bacterium]
MNLLNPNTPLVEIFEDLFTKKQIRVFVKREDLTDQYISGNKWYKLKYNLIEAEKLGFRTLLTFGGAFSNHIHAAAAAGKIFGFKTIGVIRGEEHLPLNPTLSFAYENGMYLEYIDRASYRKKYDQELIQKLKDKYGDFYLIPEGGSNHLAVKGCAEIISSINITFDYICSACGTGGTLAGLILGLNKNAFALGFSVLKGGEFLNQNISSFLKYFDADDFKNWKIILDFHFGGYAKVTKELIEFCSSFSDQHNFIIEPIYTGKMFYGLFDLIKRDYFPTNSSIIAIHTGGLQGLEGLKFRKKI